MLRIFSLLLVTLVTLSACATPAPIVGADGKPVQKLYRIQPRNEAKIQFRVLDSVNALRAASGATPVVMNAQLTAAAATHSRDMSVQNRPWHFGSDGSSPIDRVKRTGYVGEMTGELISETYETELETLAAWMDQPDTRRVILEPGATDLGISWYQEETGKIWWAMVLGENAAVLDTLLGATTQ